MYRRIVELLGLDRPVGYRYHHWRVVAFLVLLVQLDDNGSRGGRERTIGNSLFLFLAREESLLQE